ncbi:MAG: alpha/beta hydrolase [Bacilli bacterium]|nr:alpha/beta hydrolase [Bacilli bacterium]
MKVIECGIANHKTITLLHGGGLSYWNYQKEAELLKDDYHVILPILDGHADSEEGFVSIEHAAEGIIAYIDQYCGGKVHILGGLSLGAQIVVEIISKRKDIAEYLIIESAALIPDKLAHAFIKPSLASSYWLIRKKWFAKWQFQSLHLRKDLFDSYFADTCKISKKDYIAFLLANTSYQPKEEIKDCEAKARIIVGEKENKRMKESAILLHKMLKNSTLEIKEDLYHGEYSINQPERFVKEFLAMLKE